MERFNLPDDLSGLSDGDLTGLETKANERLNALRQVTNATSDDRAELAAIKAGRLALKAELKARVEFSETLTELSDVEEVVVTTSEVEVVNTDSVVETAVVEPIVSSTAVVKVKKNVPSTIIPESNRYPLTILAAADVPNFPVGTNLGDIETLTTALQAKARGLRQSDSHGRGTVYPVATIERPFDNAYDLVNLSEEDAWRRMAEGTTPQALLASGGWCAPSQILYDLLDYECVRDQLFTLTTFRITRGGIRWPIYATFDSTFDPSFVWTEADDIAASGVKACITLDCPVFTECRLDAHGLCVTVGNLMDRAYPENVRFQIRRAIRAYERAVSLRILNAVIAGSTPVSAAATFGTASPLISSLLLQAADYRQDNGMCCGDMLDVVLPCWVQDMVKADVARQEGTLSIGSLPTDAEINAWFSAANLNVRYINNWQTFGVGAATTWPAEVDYLLMAPGSWVRFDGGRLDLGVVRDSVLNSTNDFTAVWFEEFYCIGNRGPASRIVTVPVCASGDVGGNVIADGAPVCPAP